ncbi:D-TA family PLP-dependent enzyme [Prosthecobacter sp.]|uniref:D-TA family PLP-dependent enzyme n=1 Tax=Prosthecobacter sp. TaxID=1965333 RepID=UPI00378350DB
MPDWFSISNESAVPSPAMLLYPDRVEENLRRMIQQAGGAHRLRPHVKTHKLPQIIAMKLKAGITRFKAATIAEAEMTAAAGGQDVLLSYQPVGPNVDRFITLVQTYPQTRFATLADNLSTVGELSRAAVAAQVTLEVYLDLNVGMGRTGIEPGDAAAVVYRALATAPGLRAGGLHAYDGHLHDVDHAALVSAAQRTFQTVLDLAEKLRAKGHTVPRIIASGTPTFPLYAQHPEVEVGCGTTVLWDFGQAQISPDLDFLNAALLLTRVVSKPAPGRLCLDLGHKAVASEMPHPRLRLLGLEDAVFVMHSEEHLVIETPRAEEFAVGHVFYAIPRHICPTMALHHDVWAVREGRASERWEVTARRRHITL